MMYPGDAKTVGITVGDEIEIGSEQGTVRLNANLTEYIRAGAIAVPHGWGRSESGRHGSAKMLEKTSTTSLQVGNPASNRSAEG